SPKFPPPATLTPRFPLPTHSKWQSPAREKSLTPAIRRRSRNTSPGPVRFAIATEAVSFAFVDRPLRGRYQECRHRHSASHHRNSCSHRPVAGQKKIHTTRKTGRRTAPWLQQTSNHSAVRLIAALNTVLWLSESYVTRLSALVNTPSICQSTTRSAVATNLKPK